MEAGQHGGEVQDEELHLGVPTQPESHPSLLSVKSPPPKTPEAAKQGWEVETLIRQQ